MNAEPAALATLQPLTPPSLERVVTKCLAKHPDDRWDTRARRGRRAALGQPIERRAGADGRVGFTSPTHDPKSACGGGYSGSRGCRRGCDLADADRDCHRAWHDRRLSVGVQPLRYRPSRWPATDRYATRRFARRATAGVLGTGPGRHQGLHTRPRQLRSAGSSRIRRRSGSLLLARRPVGRIPGRDAGQEGADDWRRGEHASQPFRDAHQGRLAGQRPDRGFGTTGSCGACPRRRV